MKFTVERVANMIFITSECGVVFKSWMADEFTERKLKNAMNKIRRDYPGNGNEVIFTITL